MLLLLLVINIHSEPTDVVCPEKPTSDIIDISTENYAYVNFKNIYGCNVNVDKRVDGDRCNLIIYHCQFNMIINNGNYIGGAIYISLSSNKALTTDAKLIELCTFEGCTSTNGGAIYITSSQTKFTFEIIQNIFKNNKADKSGGAIYIGASSKCNIEKCQFINNKAIKGDDLFYDHNKTATATGVNFTMHNNIFEKNDFMNTDSNSISSLLYITMNSVSRFYYYDNEINIDKPISNFYIIDSTGSQTGGTFVFSNNCISTEDENILRSSNSNQLNIDFEKDFRSSCPTKEPTEPIKSIEPTNEPIEPTNEPIEPTKELSEQSKEPVKPEEPTKEITPIPTNTNPSFDDLLIDDNSYNFTDNIIEFDKEGFSTSNSYFDTANNNKNLILIKSLNSNNIIINTTADKPTKKHFISPQVENTKITISSINGNSNDFGLGELGVHANSNLENVDLPIETVPLNIFNDEISKVKFNIHQKISNDNDIALNQLIMKNGSIEFQVPEKIEAVKFNIVDVYVNESIQALRGSESIPTKINELRLNSKSQLNINNLI